MERSTELSFSKFQVEAYIKWSQLWNSW